MMTKLLITGTDTDVGKTVLTTSLVAYWQTYCKGKSLGLMKLIQTGVGDRELYHQLFDSDPSIKIITPISFATPVAPPIAAAKEGKEIELNRVWEALNSLTQEQDFVIVEALGGLGSPVTAELTVADLAADWRLPTVLVVPVKLGAIAAAVANLALARQTKIDLKGIILSCVNPESEAKLDDWTPIELIQSFTRVPVLGIIPYLVDPTDINKLTGVASSFDLEVLLPLR